MNKSFERNAINAKTEMLIGFCHGASRASLDASISDTFSYIRNEIIEIYHLINKDERKSSSIIALNELLKKPIRQLNLTSRTENCLVAEKIKTIEQLVLCTKIQLLKIPNMGKKSVDEIIFSLKELGLTLCGENNV